MQILYVTNKFTFSSDVLTYGRYRVKQANAHNPINFTLMDSEFRKAVHCARTEWAGVPGNESLGVAVVPQATLDWEDNPHLTGDQNRDAQTRAVRDELVTRFVTGGR
jgi:hypothetical protein